MSEPTESTSRGGGYEPGYRAVPCFWGRGPGSLLRLLEREGNLWPGMRVLDLGAGEGKNAAWLTSTGAEVEAVELSSHAIHNGKAAFGENVTWINDDAMKIWREPGSYDLVIAYGLLHCLPSAEIILKLMTRMRAWTAADGRCVVVAFNSRRQELEAAHPGFKPTLLAHSEYIQGFEGWAIEHESDRDLTETHPDLRIEHTHSMTRIVARRT